jgi:hypothetical protein
MNTAAQELARTRWKRTSKTARKKWSKEMHRKKAEKKAEVIHTPSAR